MKALTFELMPEIKKEGFLVGSRRKLEDLACQGLLELLPSTDTEFHKDVKVCGFVFFLNLLWQPILSFIEGLLSDPKPQWTDGHELNYSSINLEMHGIVLAADESMALEDWVRLIAETLEDLVGVSVPHKLINKVISPVVPFEFSTTPANAFHILRSSLCVHLVGPTLAEQVIKNKKQNKTQKTKMSKYKSGGAGEQTDLVEDRRGARPGPLGSGDDPQVEARLREPL